MIDEREKNIHDKTVIGYWDILSVLSLTSIEILGKIS